MTHRLAWLGLLLLVALPVPSLAQPARMPRVCALPPDLLTPDAPLQKVAAAIAAGGPVTVLAVGSATTVGDQFGGDRDAAFPYRMVAALQALLPNVSFDLTVRGGHGMTAEDMLPLIQVALATHHYDLLLWQTGTVEAVRGLPPDTMTTALQPGIEQARDAGTDVVLIDSQFSRFLRANTDLDPYETALQEVAVLPGVTLFHRYAAMESWAEGGDIDLESVRRADRRRAMTLLNACLGDALARFVLNGTHLPPP